ncbi:MULTISPECIES: AI-2E family transporter [Thalassobaculum]|uniref:Predicted PurR-regulated permease PerM n=1 Tax=Thalassobaculum litoreum DSM 18839 TaxID=1123362 RepID=A0A8G2BMT8_9PROT|nr:MULTISPECIES: AI-2E family transporter [Thalassobaculum]SDG43613.1 Predicted PurR-regulated permease PerM [Thalassobaculum litoreum DSM 18839]
MTRRERQIFWLLFLAGFLILIYVLRDVLLPFVAGMAVAYLLDPVADRLERLKLSRTLSTTIVVLAFFIITIGLMLLLLPLLQTQVEQFANAVPTYVELIRERVGPKIQELLSGFDEESAVNKLPDIAGNALTWVGNIFGKLLSGGAWLANVLSILVITPIVSFYLLRDWDKMVATIDGWLPREQAPTIRTQMGAIDRTLAAFVRGQGTVCLILGVFYAIGLSLAGLNFGLVIGLFAGLVSFVPFVGSTLGAILSVGLAAAQFDSWQPVAIIAGIFLAGQLIEGNFLTPNLVGDAVGLHPVWVIFALLAGGALFGFLGVLLAVPVAAVIGVLTRFALEHYLASPLHLHGIPPPDDAPNRAEFDDHKH